MSRNSLALPLIALLLAVIGSALLWLDLSWKSATLLKEEAIKVILDGQIAPEEYAQSFRDEATRMEIYWTIAKDEIYLGLRSPGKGWAAIALDATGPLMKGGDIIIGMVVEGNPYLRDNFANTPTSHVADTGLGGSDDLLEKAASESEKGTVLEFKRKLDTGDEYDKPITTGEHTVQLAYSDTDDFTSYHGSNRSTVTINFYEQRKNKR